MKNGYPEIHEVEAAGKYQLARWHRFLRSADLSDNEQAVQKRIQERFKALGGMTSDISKEIGW